MAREADPDARALLAELLRLEREPWPAAMDAYGSTLLMLADRCAQRAGKAEVYRWFIRRAGGVLQVRSPVMRECLLDALADIVAHASTMLLRIRSGLRDDCGPNLQSMLVRAVRWRANTLRISLHQRHDVRADRRVDPAQMNAGPVNGSAHDRVAAAEVLAQLICDDSPVARFLALVGLGHTVTDAARRTGVSRQTLYRIRDEYRP